MNDVALVPLHWRGRHVVSALIDEADLPIVDGRSWSVAPIHRRTSEWGYAMTYLDGFPIQMERLISGVLRRDPRSVHHVNQVKWDNRRSNLELFETSRQHQLCGEHKASHLERLRRGRDLYRSACAQLGVDPVPRMRHREIAELRGDYLWMRTA